jgi:hypothetical protein
MKFTNIIYWITTILICFLMAFSGYNDLTQNAGFVAAMKHLGYPDYLMTFLGVAKIAAVIVLLVPMQNRLKDWAYAGIAFDVLGAAYSHYKSGDGASAYMLPLIGFVIAMISYYFYVKKYDVSTTN